MSAFERMGHVVLRQGGFSLPDSETHGCHRYSSSIGHREGRTRTADGEGLFFARSRRLSSHLGKLLEFRWRSCLPPSLPRSHSRRGSQPDHRGCRRGESEKGENNNTGEEDQICTAKPCERAKRQYLSKLLTQVRVKEVFKRDLVGKRSV